MRYRFNTDAVVNSSIVLPPPCRQLPTSARPSRFAQTPLPQCPCPNGWVPFIRVHLGQRAGKPAQGRSHNTQHQTRQNDPKKEALRQAAQGRGRPGGAERGGEGRRPRKGARGQGFRAQTLGPGIRGDGRCRLSRQRKPQGQQGLRDREAQEEGRGARARERPPKKFPGLLESRPCARCEFIKAHRGEFGPIMRAGINIVGTRGLRTKI